MSAQSSTRLQKTRLNRLTKVACQQWRDHKLLSCAWILISLGMLARVIQGIQTCFFMNSVGRSLWVDEAMLAYSFSKRSLLGIVTGGQFEYLQSAPLGWLVFEKMIVKFMGNSEFALRSGAMLSFVGIALLLVFVQKYYYDSPFPLSGAAIMLTIPFVLRYSNEFKPYMSDALVALLACACYAMYIKRNLLAWHLAAIWCLLLCCSQTTCFVVCGLTLSSLAYAIAERDFREVRRFLIIGCTIAVVFVLYYLLWISRMTDVSAMRNWWLGNNGYLPLPTSVSNIEEGLNVIVALAKNIDPCWPIVLACVLGSVPLCLARRDRLGTGIILVLATTTFASCIRFYPAESRLWLFAIPLMVLLVPSVLERLASPNHVMTIGVGILLLALSVCNTGIDIYSKKENVYYSGEEYKQELEFLANHVEAGDMVYVYAQTVPGFEYTNGYGNRSIGGFSNNVVFGSTQFTPLENRDSVEDTLKGYEKYHIFLDRYQSEIDKVMSYEKCYFVTSHTSPPKSPTNRAQGLIEAMQVDGYLDLVSYEHETALWFHSTNIDDCKTRGKLSYAGPRAANDSGWVTVENVGEAFLGNPYDLLCLERDDGALFEVGEMLAPGCSTRVRVLLHDVGETKFTLRYLRDANMPTQEIVVPARARGQG